MARKEVRLVNGAFRICEPGGVDMSTGSIVMSQVESYNAAGSSIQQVHLVNGQYRIADLGSNDFSTGYIMMTGSVPAASWSQIKEVHEIGGFFRLCDPGGSNMSSAVIQMTTDTPPSYTFTDRGQDSVINAKVGGQVKAIRSLTPFQNKIFLGYGDITAAVRPLMVRYFDLSDNTFKSYNPGAFTPGLQTDSLVKNFVIDGVLYLLFVDPAGTSEDYATVDSAMTGVIKSSSSLSTEHAWHLIKHTDGYLYLFGASVAPQPNEPTVWRSTDGGSTWAVVLNPALTNHNWFTWAASYGGKIWTAPVNGSTGGHTSGQNDRQSTNGTTWSDSGFRLTPTFSNTPNMSVEFLGKLFIVGGGADPGGFSNNLYRFDGLSAGVNITSSVESNVFAVATNGTHLFVLCNYGEEIWRSADGVNFIRVAVLTPLSAYSMCLSGTSIFVGTYDSHVMEGIPN